MNEYGDCMCHKLLGETVDMGGLCNLWLLEDNATMEEQTRLTITDDEVIEMVESRSCVTCKHAYYNDAGQPACDVDEMRIIDVNSACGAWEEDDA
jgi:hypothetical protein